MASVRLNKFIAQHLAIGRRQADIYIERGRVLLNNQKPALGARVDPEHDDVRVEGKRLESHQSPFIYLLLNKPAGYVCSRRQQGGAPTIYALVPPQFQHLKTVGRLDKDSSGLLLLTNDGVLAHKLTHPSFSKTKQYEVTLDCSLKQQHQQLINDTGVELADGLSKLKLERLNDNKNWRITMYEGRNRQIRRTFSALGYTVTKLYRTHFGPYAVGTLLPGKVQEIPPLTGEYHQPPPA